MRYNEQTLKYLSRSCIFQREGKLKHKLGTEGSYTQRWFRLSNNILYYFKTSPGGSIVEKELVGVIILEDFQVQLERTHDGQAIFSIWFSSEDKKHYFCCQSTKICEQWVTSLQRASFSHLKMQFSHLCDIIEEKTGQRPGIYDMLKIRQRELMDMDIPVQPIRQAPPPPPPPKISDGHPVPGPRPPRPPTKPHVQGATTTKPNAAYNIDQTPYKLHMNGGAVPVPKARTLPPQSGVTKNKAPPVAAKRRSITNTLMSAAVKPQPSEKSQPVEKSQPTPTIRPPPRKGQNGQPGTEATNLAGSSGLSHHHHEPGSPQLISWDDPPLAPTPNHVVNGNNTVDLMMPIQPENTMQPKGNGTSNTALIGWETFE